MNKQIVDEAFKLLIANIQSSYQDWEDLATVLKKAGLRDKDMKVAKKVFDKERRKK